MKTIGSLLRLHDGANCGWAAAADQWPKRRLDVEDKILVV